MDEEVLDVQAFEEVEGEAGATAAQAGEVRPLPERRTGAELDAWRGEVRAVALAAAGGIAAGAATAVAVGAIRARAAGRHPARILRRGAGDDGILASRSFRIDVHLLDR